MCGGKTVMLSGITLRLRAQWATASSAAPTPGAYETRLAVGAVNSGTLGAFPMRLAVRLLGYRCVGSLLGPAPSAQAPSRLAFD